MPAKLKYPIIDGEKQCSECGQWKSISEFNKARKHLSPKCKTCKSVWAKEYRQRPEVRAKAQNYHKNYMADPENRERKNSYGRQRNKRSDVKETRNQDRRKWAGREKLKAIEYKGGKCIICGYSKCAAALDFHHLDPAQKEGYGTGALKAHWTFEKNKPELDKCVLLCVRCHRELHAGEIKI